jgi:hypothetical protein
VLRMLERGPRIARPQCMAPMGALMYSAARLAVVPRPPAAACRLPSGALHAPSGHGTHADHHLPPFYWALHAPIGHAILRTTSSTHMSHDGTLIPAHPVEEALLPAWSRACAPHTHALHARVPAGSLRTERWCGYRCAA